MLDLARDLLPLLDAGIRVAAVTVTTVARSAPRGVGATMAVTEEGVVLGSISGGCVEGEAIALAHLATATGTGHAARFGFGDDAAYAAGLACGGTVDVLAYPVRDEPATRAALASAAAGRPAALGILASGPRIGTLVPGDPVGDSRMLSSAYEGEDVLLVAATVAPRLVIVGAGEHAAALCRVAAAAGFRVSVCDAWPTLATTERFPAAADVVAADPVSWLERLDPTALDARTAVCVLTHDERIDIPALEAALRLPVGFVGALGARTTVARRAALLCDLGVSEADLARIHSPLGLDLGGATPEETAVSVLAEIIASRHDGSGLPLRDLNGPLHRRAAAATCIPATSGGSR